MPRATLIRTNQFPYHVTNRSNNRDQFYLPREILWPIFCDKLAVVRRDFHCRVHAFVLMSNHYHLLVTTPESNIGDAMRYFHREVAREANRLAGRINHFFGGRYKWCLVDSERYYWNSVKYVFRNPVVANMVNRVEEYRFSSLNTMSESVEWEMDDVFNGISGVQLDRDWLNASFDSKQHKAIRSALRRRRFQLPKQSGFPAKLDMVSERSGAITFKKETDTFRKGNCYL